MNDRSRIVLPGVALILASQFPSVAIAQSSAASAASQPPQTDAKVIDPTFFVAVGVALIVGFFIGRISVQKRAAA